MTQVHIPAEAWSQVFLATDWYETRSFGAGADLMREVHRTIDKIRENPLQFPVIDEGTRRALLRRFPYGLYYVMEHGVAVIFAMESLDRSPVRWKQRKGAHGKQRRRDA